MFAMAEPNIASRRSLKFSVDQWNSWTFVCTYVFFVSDLARTDSRGPLSPLVHLASSNAKGVVIPWATKNPHFQVAVRAR
jgi:hypothetical protein